jgi:hypothetical protein
MLRSAENSWVAAEAFEYMEQRSREEIEPYPIPDTFADANLTPPKIVLQLFSLELHFKALLQERNGVGEFPHTNDLHQLFRALPKADRLALEEQWIKSKWRRGDGETIPRRSGGSET